MFHGTAVEFDRVERRPNKRTDSDGTIKWQGEAIFAAMDPRTALHYTAERGGENFSRGIDLINHTGPEEPLVFYLEGGKSKEEALNHFYGDPNQPETCTGYIHVLDRGYFVREPGLGSMEMITRDEKANLGGVPFNRREAIDDLVRSNDIAIHWRPR
jgi:hypothetical protein